LWEGGRNANDYGKGACKRFWQLPSIKGAEYEVKAGEIYGFIGQNGSGKTTTMNILAGLSRPAQGECIVNGRDVTRLIHPGDLNIGYLPEDPKFYLWMTAHETLVYLSGVRKTGGTGEILRWTGLAAAQYRRLRES
jgi:ABC-type multidrug transport system ATPase subunit